MGIEGEVHAQTKTTLMKLGEGEVTISTQTTFILPETGNQNPSSIPIPIPIPSSIPDVSAAPPSGDDSVQALETTPTMVIY